MKHFFHVSSPRRTQAGMQPAAGAVRAACATAALLATAVFAPAYAVVALTEPPTASGDYAHITYGNGGDVFELQPYLFVNGLGGGNDARSVSNANAALSFSFGAASSSPGLLTITYTVANLSATETFDQLRFMVFANPDGDQAQYLDVIGGAWGAAAPGDPSARQVMALPADPNIVSVFKLNNRLSDGGAPAACTVAAGCDAIVALQWEAAQIGPGERLEVRVGLSDDGSRLSSQRWLTAAAVMSPATTLTFSGTVSVVPEPAPWTLLLGGFGAVAAGARRRFVCLDGRV